MDDLTLFPVFEYLRKQGVPLGVSEYLTVVEALRQDYCEGQPDKIEQLCRLLWAKSRQDQEVFDFAFARLARPRLEEQARAESAGQVENEGRPASEPSSAREPERGKQDGEMGPGSVEPRRAGELPRENDEPEDQGTMEALAFNFSLAWEEGELDLPAFSPARFQLTPRLPIGVREMATAWRHLRLPQRSGPKVELDVEGTLDDISRRGLFLGPRLQPRRRNQADMLVLVDASASMEPFSLLVETLLESILRVGLLDQVSVYYFDGVPRRVFYARPGLQGEVPAEEVLGRQAAGRSVLVVSDAGAANPGIDAARLQGTRSFLKALNAVTYLYAWLNPLPPDRWQATSAGSIACLVPMFPIDRDGLNDAVSILRGHPFPPDVNLNEGDQVAGSA